MKVSVNKDVITWARERAGLEVDDLVKRFPKFPEWEQGTDSPTLSQLRGLAQKLFAPLGYFFLPAPPNERLPIKDFRSADNQPIDDPSPHLLDTVFEMQRRQAWYKDFLLDEGAGPLAFVGSAAVTDDPAAVALKIRKTLGMVDSWAKSIPTWTQALDELAYRAEEVGVLVVRNGVVGNNSHRKLDVKEFRGFVLSDSIAPLVFINNSDSKSAQLFTLAHELAHLWIGTAGVVNLAELQPANNEIEQFCNKVAAEVLVPEHDMRAAWRDAKNKLDPFQSLARHFKVSPIVAARRALDLGLIDQTFFFEFYNNYLKDEGRKNAARAGGGDFFANCNHRIGRPFAQAVLRATHGGKLLYTDAYRLTGLSGRTFDKYLKQVGSEIG